MNKDILVLLLQKDIRELGLLTDGFEKMSEFPEALLHLAKDKAENVVKMLDELSKNVPEPELGAIDYQSFGEEFDAEELSEVATEDSTEPTINTDEEKIVASATEEQTELEIQEETQEPESREETDVEEKEDWDVERVMETEKTESDEETEKEEELVVEENGPQESNKFETDTPSMEHTASVLNDTLSHEDNSISSNLANLKIDDIRQAINIGDRFRFQRELFGGNGEVLNKTISYLNQLAKFEEAETFLKSKFNWAEDDIHAEDFLQIVRRRYL